MRTGVSVLSKNLGIVAQFVSRSSRVSAFSCGMLPTHRLFSTEALHEEKPMISGANKSALLAALTPKQVVEQLDKFIVGQNEAKRAVAIALRNRWRRHQLNPNFRNEVIPKNILMVGPTGCGKTEIARRIAKLSQAPFIKVEATKFTEVGFHGKDVDQIIRDLLDVSINMTKKRLREEKKAEVSAAVTEKILDALVGVNSDESQRNTFRQFLIDLSLEDRIIEVEVPTKASRAEKTPIAIDPSNSSAFANEIFKMVRPGNGKKSLERKKLPISEARPLLEEMEADRLMEEVDVIKEAISAVEDSGIVFIDEIDKLINTGDYRGADASSEGVQRDLLPLIEGSTISTKHGNVNTDFILFIASGAFHQAKPSDLLAELQGRLPIRVTLKGLTEDDLFRILTEPVTNLIQQQVELLKSENVHLTFTTSALREIARVAFQANQLVENIGARRLHTVIEKIVEEISFDASERGGETIEVDEDYVKKRVSGLLANADLRKYII